MKTKSTQLYTYMQGVFVVVLQVVIFLTAFFVTTTTFAQEKEILKEVQSEKTEVISKEKNEKEIAPIKEEIKPVESELSKEQLKQIAELDKLLKAEKITQEEYDKKKVEIIGAKPIEEEALMSRSSIEIEPEAQTLGKYIAPTVSTSNGSLNYQYPIVVPQGRNGLTPEISLMYNSNNKSQSSIIGTGWSLNIPYIQRVNKKGTDKLYTEDYFISSLDGGLIDQGNGIYTPRTENGSFLKYEYSNDTWTVTDKQGTVYEFGATTQARQDNPSDTTQIFSWMLETVTDTNNNTIDYTYFKDQGQIYPDTISYNQSGLFDVVFKRVIKTNPYTSSSSAFEVTTAYSINEIEVSTDNSVTATYDISIIDNLVKDITITGFEGVSSFELPPVEFEYLNEVSSDSWSSVREWNFDIDHEEAIRFADVNGDGLPDRIEAYKEGNNSTRQKVYLNNGSGWETSSNNTWSSSFPHASFYFWWESNTSSKPDRSTNKMVIDVNGDGLADLIDNDGVYLNTGSSWSSVREWNFNIDHEEAIRFADVNGDGLPDRIEAYKEGNNSTRQKVYLNNGSGWETSSNNTWSSSFPHGGFYFYRDYRSSSKTNRSTNKMIIDINGDGLADLIDDDAVYFNDSENPSVSKITNSQKGSTELTYTTANIQDTSNVTPFPVHVVESITTGDNNGNTATISYEYRDADYYFNSPHDKKFAGFGSVIKTNADGSIETTKYHQANGETGNEPTDSYAKLGKSYEQTIEDSSNNLFSLNRTNYIETSLGNNAYAIQRVSELTQRHDGTSSYTDTAVEYNYDAYGNINTQTQYGVVNGNTDGTFSDTGSDKRTVEYTYTNDAANYIVGLPTNQTLKNNSGTKEAETNYSYDSSGNLVTESKWITGSDYSDTTYTYNSYGLPLTETDALNNTTTYVYDTDAMYPASVTNALSQVTNYLYDYSSGKVTQITEPNGKVTQYDYDGLDRLIEIAGTVGNGGTQVLKDISYNTTANPQYTKARIYTGTESQDIYTYTDGFGKTIQTKSEMDNDWLTLDTIFDDMGRVQKQSLPYETTSSSHSNPTSNNNLMTSFNHDVLGRVISTTNAKGTTTTDYDGFETTITDAENNEKDLVTDAFGNLVTVKEYNGSSVYTTDYEYNTRNLLTKITDAENNERNISYDGLGRRTILEDLHTSSDTTFGTWNFTYDDINLTSQTDPNGTTTSYTYDDLHRVLTEDNNSSVGTDITYTYDSCTNGTGNVCSTTTPDITTTYTYLKQGLVDTESKVIDAVTYTTNTDYDRQGNVTKVTHPNASYTEYEYNTRGLVDDVKYNGTSLVTADYGVHGRPTLQTHSNGVTSTYTYDDSELYELTNKTTSNGTTDFQNLSYSYDNVGNITQIVDASDTDTAKTQTFSYDDLYRLTSTTVTNSANSQDYTRSYTYSPIGNITAFNGVNYSYTDTGYSNPHAVTNIGGTSYSYDNNGNLTNDGTWTHTWDYRNRLASSTDGTTTSNYEYDSNNQRIKLVEGSDTTIYPTPDYEIKNGNVKVSLNLADTLVATDDNGTINHVHTDHLGGTNITTDTTGVITQTLDYYPFGETRIDAGTDNETKQFTGYVKDASTGLSYAGARYHNGQIGRFISQDPANLRLGISPKEQQQLIADPQQLNTYSYVRNNPIMFNDPSGELIFLAPLLGAAEVVTIATPVLIASAQYLPAVIDNPELTARISPGTSDLIDGAEFVTGNNVVSGEKLSTEDRVLAGVGLGAPLVGGKLIKLGLDEIPSDVKSSIAEQIAKGHAWTKHVIKGGEFPTVRNQNQFQNLIQDTMDNFTNGKSIDDVNYYGSTKNNMVVVENPSHPDGGTAYKPYKTDANTKVSKLKNSRKK